MLDKIKNFIAHSKEEILVPRYTVYLDYVLAAIITIEVISYIV